MPEHRRVVSNHRGSGSKTKQSFKNECDINHILEKHRNTGVVSQDYLNKRQAMFADVSEIGDFQHCQQKVLDAEEAFMTLPSRIRTRFENDPGQLLDFVADPGNRNEAIELGIIPKPEQVKTEKPLEPQKDAPQGAQKPKEDQPKA